MNRPLVIPASRDKRVPVIVQCNNPHCRVLDKRKGKMVRFTFSCPPEADKIQCPKCGACEPPLVTFKTLTHFTKPDPRGKILGKYGKYSLACDPKRPLATTRNNLEQMTNLVEAVNCPLCLEWIKKNMPDKATWLGGAQVTLAVQPGTAPAVVKENESKDNAKLVPNSQERNELAAEAIEYGQQQDALDEAAGTENPHGPPRKHLDQEQIPKKE